MKIPPLSEFLNDINEWHALMEGFLEPFTFFWYKPIPLDYYKRVIVAEHHYYRFGKAIGAILLVAIIGLAIWWLVK